MEPKESKFYYSFCRAVGHQLVTFRTREDAALFIRLETEGPSVSYRLLPIYCPACDAWHVKVDTSDNVDGKGVTERG